MAGGGPITAAVDVPGGPILARNHRWLDRNSAQHDACVGRVCLV